MVYGESDWEGDSGNNNGGSLEISNGWLVVDVSLGDPCRHS